MRADCVSTALKAQGALLLTVPYAEIAPEERPDGDDRRPEPRVLVGPDGVVTILLSPTPAD